MKHQSRDIIDALTDEIHSALSARTSELIGSNQSADVSDFLIKALSNRISRLREIRIEVEDLFSLPTHPGF